VALAKAQSPVPSGIGCCNGKTLFFAGDIDEIPAGRAD
jgi:hypothetical protein